MKTPRYNFSQLLVAILITINLGFNRLTRCKEEQTKPVEEKN